MQQKQSRAWRWLILTLLGFVTILLTSPYEPPKERPFLWAAEPIHTQKVTDRVALSPPVGYSFWTLEPPDTAVLEDWTVYPLNEQEPGALRITAHEEKFWTFMETFEDHCVQEHSHRFRHRHLGISTLQFIDGQRACSTTAGRETETDVPSQVRSLCRHDGCWSFMSYGDPSTDRIPGRFLEIFDTIRFVPVPDPEPDFRLGE